MGILDYGVGNLASIANAVRRTGHESTLVGVEHGLPKISHLIIPGVGSFGYCKEKLINSNLYEILLEYIFNRKINALGICVGMQLMFAGSDESPTVLGFGWVNGYISKLKSVNGCRVPHVGWNNVRFEKKSLGFSKGDSPNFYFDHSYALKTIDPNLTIASSDYGGGFSAIVEKENLLGIQFHPEKSQKNGALILENFLKN